MEWIENCLLIVPRKFPVCTRSDDFSEKFHEQMYASVTKSITAYECYGNVLIFYTLRCKCMCIFYFMYLRAKQWGVDGSSSIYCWTTRHCAMISMSSAECGFTLSCLCRTNIIKTTTIILLYVFSLFMQRTRNDAQNDWKFSLGLVYIDQNEDDDDQMLK